MESKSLIKIVNTNIIPLSLCLRSTFSSFSSKYGKDPRFKAVEKMRDREDYFKEHVEALYKKEREDKRKEKEKVD